YGELCPGCQIEADIKAALANVPESADAAQRLRRAVTDTLPSALAEMGFEADASLAATERKPEGTDAGRTDAPQDDDEAAMLRRAERAVGETPAYLYHPSQESK